MNPNDPDLMAVNRRCQCRVEHEGIKGRRPPIRIYGPTADAIARAGVVATSTPFGTYRCPTCKGVLFLTVGDVHLA